MCGLKQFFWGPLLSGTRSRHCPGLENPGGLKPWTGSGPNNSSLLSTVLLLLLVFWGCSPEPVLEPEPVDIPHVFVPAEGKDVVRILENGLRAQGLDNWKDLAPAVERSLEYVSTRDQDAWAVCEPGLCLSWNELKKTLELFLGLLPKIDGRPDMFKDFFEFYAVNPDVLLTGYYEPLLRASRDPSPEYPHPVYAKPGDLLTADLGRFHPRWKGQQLVYRMQGEEIVPYYERREIDQKNVLQGRNLEIAWVDDPIELFFLHIQGSGRLEYPDGGTEHVLYAGRNGRQYVALGRVLVELGFLEENQVSMQAIRAFLRNNSGLKADLMAKNPSYIFFHLAEEGPKGAMGRILTPWVSVASDPGLIPWGSLMVLDAELPEFKGQKNRIHGPVLAQDTGGAIRGRHLDLFCGFGERPEYLAGKMQGRANVYLMVRKHGQN